MLKRTLTVGLVSLFLFVPMASAQSTPFSVDFSGGTLNELMNEIIEDDGFVPNVIISDDAGNVKIPPIHFEDVALKDFMVALSCLDLPLKFEAISGDVWSVRALHSSGEVHVHSIRGLLGLGLRDSNNSVYFAVDDIATAIQTAWDMKPSLDNPNIKVHLETSLLMIQGDDERQEIAAQVIKQLSSQQERVQYANENVQLHNQLKDIKNEREQADMMLNRVVSEKEYLEHTWQQRTAILEDRLNRLSEENSMLRMKLIESQKTQ